ncbi:SapC family protein [Aliarcobacter cryaerophilus]|uniref:SapC family protein n=1 Tax=Aliarcobacter cryaerophilus TaxID=28198 RepID=UPI0021B422B6|nr:SapC family protein [Aliarcobacter cryaerophilus]MCT7464300.1 SapC family protein [Aliarcobacter cryaerophilus]
MYKNITILDKEKLKTLKFDDVNKSEIARNVGLIPLGFIEVWYASHDCPVIISAGENAEFLAFTGITKEISIFNKNEVYLPAFVRSYPFLNVNVSDEDNRINSVIAIDENVDFVGKSKKIFIFDKEKNLTKEASLKIELVRELNRQREVSKAIINELKEHDLLIKKDLKVNIDNEEKTILDEFYIINIEKLIQLDDAILAAWARKGWMGIFDAHIKSMNNFQKVFSANK